MVKYAQRKAMIEKQRQQRLAREHTRRELELAAKNGSQLAKDMLRREREQEE